MELSKNNHNRSLKAIAIGAATIVATQPFANEPVAAETYIIDTQLSEPYCSEGKTVLDYGVRNVNNPATIDVSLELNNQNVVTEPLDQGQTKIGSYATSLVFGQPYTAVFKYNGSQVGNEYTGTGLECGKPLLLVEPNKPVINDLPGSDRDTIIIPDQTGVDYYINQQKVLAGTRQVAGNIVVDALPAEGYRFEGTGSRQWIFELTDTYNSDSNENLSTPSVVFSDQKKVTIKKEYRKKCKKVNSKRRYLKGKAITKKQKKFLKTKCKIKHINIFYSTPNTKIYQGIPYNWGVKPLDTGGIIDKNAEGYNYLFSDEVSIDDGPNISENVFDESGKLNYVNDQTSEYFTTSRYVDSNNKFELVSNVIDQPKAYKKIPGEVVDTQIATVYCNESDEYRSVTTGLKTQSKKPKIITEETVSLNPGECREIIVSDSANQPPHRDEIEKTNPNPNRFFVHVNPDKSVSLKFRNSKKGIFYYRINSDSPVARYFQRSVLIGVRDKGWDKNVKANLKYDKPIFNEQERFKRNW